MEINEAIINEAQTELQVSAAADAEQTFIMEQCFDCKEPLKDDNTSKSNRRCDKCFNDVEKSCKIVNAQDPYASASEDEESEKDMQHGGTNAMFSESDITKLEVFALCNILSIIGLYR